MDWLKRIEKLMLREKNNEMNLATARPVLAKAFCAANAKSRPNQAAGVLKFKYHGCLMLVLFMLLSVMGCNFNTVIDTNQSVEDNKWLYANPTNATFEINDISKRYDVNFKLRISNEYRYANLYVLATFKQPKSTKKVRYQFKLAKADGQWMGKGSGDLYTYSFPLLKNQLFADTGKYSIEIEQNMRDNPLLGVSDIGIEVK